VIACLSQSSETTKSKRIRACRAKSPIDKADPIHQDEALCGRGGRQTIVEGDDLE